MAKKQESAGDFSKITSSCNIKQVAIKKGGKYLRLADFEVSSNQAESIESVIEMGEAVQIIISPIQKYLPGTQ